MSYRTLFCKKTRMSYRTPPFGPAAFCLKGLAPPEISLQDIGKAHRAFHGPSPCGARHQAGGRIVMP